MIHPAFRIAAVALLCCSVAARAQADAAPDVQTKINAAMKRARSFVVATEVPAHAYSSTIVFVAPDRYRIAVAVAASTTDVITVGNMQYSSKNGAPFEKAPLAADEGARMKQIGQIKVGAAHADVVVDGVTYGAFDTVPTDGDQTPLTCAYDKATFRLVRCANDDVTQTFAGYDDPKNVVDVPAGAQ